VTRTRIKFCGITSVEDALLAAECGADAIGMVFHPPAKRNISLELAAEIVRALPPFVTPVGLFVDADANRILHIAGKLGLSTVQFHGHERPELVNDVSPLRVLKAIRVDDAIESTLAMWRQSRPVNLAGLVLETAGIAGGSGAENDWPRVAALKAKGAFDGLPPLIAAGGLRPATVTGVIRQIHPAAVDVSSGIEETPGRKSKTLMVTFAEAVRTADKS
jgi:phosphoribosylanthranilate isomerase